MNDLAHRVLVVDDEESMREWLSIFLRKQGYRVSAAADGPQALARVRGEVPDLVIADLQMPGMDGMELLKRIKQERAETVVIVITAYGTERTAQTVMELGAYDYFTKPFEVDEIQLVIEKALDKVRLERENTYLRERLGEEVEHPEIVARGPRMKQVLELVRRVAELSSTVLITGESGTGKELIARAIHRGGPRRAAPFVAVNCAALPETLLESELFGHERGAFTGAVAQRKGKIELANDGTLFLDEIGDMSLTTQAKVLRVLQDKRITRLGGMSEIGTDVRVVAATNQDLEQLVAEGRFREDLFYRLNVIPVHLPPLRRRPEDVPALLDHFLARFSRQMGVARRGFTAPARRVLEEHDWPGNVRELANLVERTVALSEGPMIGTELLPDNLCKGRPAELAPLDLPSEGIDLDATLASVERRLLLQALDRAVGVKVEAARLLRISFRSLRYRLQKLAIEDSQ